MKNKKTILTACFAFLLFALLNLSATAQDQGIHFEHGLSWKAVQEKAKKENKFIFRGLLHHLSCGPCKMMSQEIFPLKEVGDFFNKHFVSVKVQFDRTSKDNEEVKAWYEDAAYFRKEYKVLAYPTFLYFTLKAGWCICMLAEPKILRNSSQLQAVARSGHAAFHQNGSPGATSGERSLDIESKSAGSKSELRWRNMLPGWRRLI